MSKTTTSGKTPESMTPEAIEKAARADPDAQPLTENDLQRMKRTPQARIIRRALELTQEGLLFVIIYLSARCGTGNRVAQNQINRRELI